MLKAMILGCGRIAGGMKHALSTHGGAYQARDGVSIVACIDDDQERSHSFAEDYRCEAEKDLHTAIEKHQPDIISVCTSDTTHFSITEQIFQAKHRPQVVFLEKPVCRTQEELDYLIGLSAQVGVPIVVNHSRRFDQHHQQLRDRIISGEFGDLRSAYTTYYSGWLHNGVHIIDTLSYLFDDSIIVDMVTNAWESPYEGDPTMELLANFKEQNSKIYLTGFVESDYQLFEMDLRFSEARLRFEDFGERILLETKYINDIGENVIQMADNGLGKKTETSMQQAIDLICRSIEENNPILLHGYLLQDVAETMQTIWQGQEEYEKYRFN